jgi:hypothetical protein
MIERAKVPYIDYQANIITSHMQFRTRNSGRLVSEFLLSFSKCA